MAKQSFEQKLQELESILKELETNKEISIDDSLSLYEKGVRLIRECTKVIEEAEAKISEINETSE